MKKVTSVPASTVRRRSVVGPVLLTAAWLAGCAGTIPVTYYGLGNTAATAPGAATAATVGPSAASEVVTLAPVRVAELIDRPQIVVATTGREVIVSDTHRWAEPLTTAIERRLMAQLRATRPSAWIATERSGPVPRAAWRIALVVDEIRAPLGGTVSVVARWQVQGADGAVARLGQATVDAAAHSSGYDALVDAIGAAVDEVCARVAADLSRATN